MLILSRKLGESIVIDGRITVKIVRLEGDIVKLGIDAPLEVPVHRQEVYDEIQRSNSRSAFQRIGKSAHSFRQERRYPRSHPSRTRQSDHPKAPGLISMVTIPKISSEAAASSTQSDQAALSAFSARRNLESQGSSPAPDNAKLSSAQPLETLAGLPWSEADQSDSVDARPEIEDANGADALMSSLRAGFLAQPGAGMLAQANLSPQNVLNLLQ